MLIQWACTYSYNRQQYRQLASLLSFYQINLGSTKASSTFLCDCNLYHLKMFIHTDQARYLTKGIAYPNNLLVSDSNFQTWRCRANHLLQPEVTIQSFLTVPSKYFLCSYEGYCPPQCECLQGASDAVIVVDCTSRGLTKMPENILIPTGKTRLIVSLENNKITSFEDCGQAEYKWLEHVTVLNIQTNDLFPPTTDDTANFLACLKRISNLSLAHNSIQYLPLSIQEYHHVQLTISNNPLICDCTSYWMKLWLQDSNGTVADYQDIQCVNKLYPIVQLEEKDFSCEKDIVATLIAGIFGCLLPITVIPLISCYIYRFEIKVLLFEKFNWHPFDRQNDQEHKDYDVYLMYCQDDEIWVTNTLLVGLNKLGYKTCIPDRDFAVGASTAEEMAAAFTRTHRVLVIVSQCFLDNVHAMSDFYHAYEHDRLSNRRFLVLIKLREKLRFGERRDIFKRYISTNYFVSIKSRRFWSQLQYWLPLSSSDTLPTSTDNIELDGEGEDPGATESTPLLVNEDALI